MSTVAEDVTKPRGRGPRRRHRRTGGGRRVPARAPCPRSTHAVDMEIDVDGEKIDVTAEVAQQIGEGRVRCICLKPTDGLRRGTAVTNTGRGITVPVGDAVLGHVFNVTGDQLDRGAMGKPDD